MQKYRCFFNQIHFLMFKMPFFFIHFYISTHIFTSLSSLREKQKSLTGQRKRLSKKQFLPQPALRRPAFFPPPPSFFPDKDYNFASLHHQAGGGARLDRYHPAEKLKSVTGKAGWHNHRRSCREMHGSPSGETNATRHKLFLMHRFEILFLDLDGTLTDSRKELTPFTRHTLIDAQRKGLRLALASGRPTYGILPLAEMLEMKRYGGYILSYNGGKIIRCDTEETLFEQSLPDDILPLLYRRSVEAGASILSYNGPKILTETPENHYVQYESFLTKMDIQPTDDFLADLPRPVDKCLTVGEPDLLVWLEEELKKEIGHRINIYRSEPFYLELVPKGIDKAASIARLLAHIGVEREKAMAIGDGFNDLSMIHYAGLGVAMANAQEKVKQEADVITRHTNDEDGVARFLLEELPEL